MVEIGTMRQRITIQEHRTVVDGIGNHTSSWEDFHSCFAYVNLASGKEYGAAATNVSEDTLVFVIRWCKKLRGLNSREYRISYAGNVYDVTCVDDVQFRHEKLKLTAVKESRG